MTWWSRDSRAGDEAFGGSFVAADVVVAAEFAVGLAGREHVPVGDEHRVLDGAECATVPDAGFQALVFGLEVAVLDAGRGERGSLERDPAELAALAAFVQSGACRRIGRAGQRPGREVPGGGEHAHVGLIAFRPETCGPRRTYETRLSARRSPAPHPASRETAPMCVLTTGT